jgi:drug/metabolite transporter (DMT)-like permease
MCRPSLECSTDCIPRHSSSSSWTRTGAPSGVSLIPGRTPVRRPSMAGSEPSNAGGSPAHSSEPGSTDQSDTARKRSQLTVITGLFVTFAGLLGYALQIPSQPSLLSSTVPWLAVGFITGWSGGILAGNALVAPPPGFPPALRGQPAVAAIATLAGVLSAAVAIRRIGPWVSPSAGGPAELLVAVVAVLLVWIGGFLIGHSMRRFVRRRRRVAPR